MRKFLSSMALAATSLLGVSTGANAAYVEMTVFDVTGTAGFTCSTQSLATISACTNTFNGVTGATFSGLFVGGTTINFAGVVGGFFVTQASSTSNAPGNPLAANISQTVLSITNNYATSAQFFVDVTVFGFTNPTGVLQDISGTGTVQSSTLGASATNQVLFYADPTDSGNTSNMLGCTASIANIQQSTSAPCNTGTSTWNRGVGPSFSLRDVQLFTTTAGASVQVSATVTTTNAVPEPATTALVGVALLGLALTARRKSA